MGLYKKGQLWGIDYYDGYRRRRKLVGSSKGQARNELSKKIGERASGRTESNRIVKDLPFHLFAERYMEDARVMKRGFRNEKYRIQQIAKFFGKRMFSTLTAWDGEQFKIAECERVAPATVNRSLVTLKHMGSMGVAWNHLTVHPFKDVKLLKTRDCPVRILTKEEEGRLLVACSQVRAPLLPTSVVIALNTGMRKGEIHGLKWEHVDLPNRLISVWDSKTDESDRRIPMNEVVYELLSNLWQQHKGEFVFPSPRKKNERFRDPKVGFMKAVKLAKIPHIRFHDLRHTFATRLVRSGVDIVTVQHLLGHSNIMMTSRYAHSDADAKMAAVKLLADVR
jgi:integrase